MRIIISLLVALICSAAAPSPADQAFSRGMDRMSQDMMAVHATGDTDRDFVGNMLPHHAGAVDMAQTELRYGHDPALRQLAGDIIAAQRREIAIMKAWLARHSGP